MHCDAAKQQPSGWAPSPRALPNEPPVCHDWPSPYAHAPNRRAPRTTLPPAVLNYLRDGWVLLPKTAEERRELLQEIGCAAPR